MNAPVAVAAPPGGSCRRGSSRPRRPARAARRTRRRAATSRSRPRPRRGRPGRRPLSPSSKSARSPRARVPSVERRLARDADAPQRPRRLADRLDPRATTPTPRPPPRIRATSRAPAIRGRGPSRRAARGGPRRTARAAGSARPRTRRCRASHDDGDVVPVERVRPGRQFVERQAERVEVGAAVDACVAPPRSKLLRRGVSHGADEGAGLRRAATSPRGARRRGPSPSRRARRDDDVVGLQVAVHGAPAAWIANAFAISRPT